ncbi:MAG: 2-oxoacid:acceptor oxidoreductase family protein [Candidatus Omnitrophica bacterium]|nr:2-oxoacid:acceptor oxidoreductase family protein [Candidatus Omnitrophota bacterium]
MDARFLQERGTQVYTGTELLLKGALEGKVSLLTGYPGSPIADFFNSARNIKELLKDKGILFQIANNEALGAARVNGSQMEDIKAIVAMKSVGAHVASDGLALGNLSKTSHKGGALVVIGDDPWSESTQVPSDSRYLAKHLHMPVMEPATFQELKDWVPVALDLSAKSNLYVAYLVTTNLADGGGSVTVYANQYPSINTKRPVEIDTRSIPVEETVVLSPRTAVREESLADRYEQLIQFSRMHEVNQIFYGASSHQIGFITSGIAYSYLEHALHELGLDGKFPILKLGITFPLDETMVKEFSESLDQVFVIEEKRDFLESQIATLFTQLFQTGKLKRFIPIWGKKFPHDLPGIPATRGLNASVLAERLGPLFLKLAHKLHLNSNKIEEELALIQETASLTVRIPQRTPTFCPGCPHRDSSSVLLEVKKDFRDPSYMRKHHRKEAVDLLFHGDTGCYTMLMFEPNAELMHNYSGMGLGGGTGAGIDRFITNKQAVFMGDSTFFHSGMIAISDAIKHSQDITFIILDNGTTAMTGHQPTAAQEFDIVGNRTVAQNIEEVVRGMAKGTTIPIYRTNPAYREEYRELIEETLLQDGVKIIIADKECGITYDRKVTRQEKQIARERGFLPEKRFINITPEVCEYCLECTKATGCPGLTVKETHYGPKLVTDLSWCKADGACTKIHACPSFEELIVKRSQAPLEISQQFDIRDLPEQSKWEDFEDKWGAYVAGVGGMGIGVVTAILVQAGIKQGYHVRFADKKGLAIRNGGVYSHILFSKNGGAISPITPYGKANLLIGLDILEAVRSVDPKVNLRVASPRFTSSLINTHKTPTVTMLLGKDDFKPSDLENVIRRASRPDRYLGADISEVAEQYLGNKVFANIIMLGMAYQKGFLPLDLENLRAAIEKSVPADALKDNINAFNLGRLFVVDPKRFATEVFDTYESLLAEKEEILKTTHLRGKLLARAYRNLVVRTAAALRMDDETNMHLALRIYDLIQFDDLSYARLYADLVKKVRSLDRAECRFEATQVVLRNLHKVMAIKDEVFVSHLLTSVEKKKRDFQRYRIDLKRGDKVVYRHLNRPEFMIFGFHIRFHLITRDWQLEIMKRMKFLRRLLPGWHAREKAFRDWYIQLVKGFQDQDQASYLAYVRALQVPEKVSGYREVRYPKMEAAKAEAEAILNGSEPSGERNKESSYLVS